MKRYAKIVNEETKECQVGLGTNTEFYESLGMEEMDVEEGYNGQWYVEGYAPEKPQEEINQERILELKNELAETDYVVIKIAEAETIEEQNMLREHYSDIIVNRKHWREEINELEAE